MEAHGKEIPDFERGESASETGRTHIPPRLFKEAVRPNRQKDKIAQLLQKSPSERKKKKSAEIDTILTDYIPSVEKLMTRDEESRQHGERTEKRKSPHWKRNSSAASQCPAQLELVEVAGSSKLSSRLSRSWRMKSPPFRLEIREKYISKLKERKSFP